MKLDKDAGLTSKPKGELLDAMAKVLAVIERAGSGSYVSLDDILKRVKIPSTTVRNALNALERHGAIKSDGSTWAIRESVDVYDAISNIANGGDITEQVERLLR